MYETHRIYLKNFIGFLKKFNISIKFSHGLLVFQSFVSYGLTVKKKEQM